MKDISKLSSYTDTSPIIYHLVKILFKGDDKTDKADTDIKWSQFKNSEKAFVGALSAIAILPEASIKTCKPELQALIVARKNQLNTLMAKVKKPKSTVLNFLFSWIKKTDSPSLTIDVLQKNIFADPAIDIPSGTKFRQTVYDKKSYSVIQQQLARENGLETLQLQYVKHYIDSNAKNGQIVIDKIMKDDKIKAPVKRSIFDALRNTDVPTEIDYTKLGKLLRINPHDYTTQQWNRIGYLWSEREEIDIDKLLDDDDDKKKV
jgi:hypothetical protein